MSPADTLRNILFHVRGVRDLMQPAPSPDMVYAMERSVERAIDVIGAKVKLLPIDLLARHPQVDWKEIIHFGESVRDSRRNVDTPLLDWLANRVIPSLEQPVLAMIAEVEAVERTLNG